MADDLVVCFGQSTDLDSFGCNTYHRCYNYYNYFDYFNDRGGSAVGVVVGYFDSREYVS